MWYKSGCQPVVIRWVLVRDPQGHDDTHAFLSTHVDHTPLHILTWFGRRWRMEVTFAEARAVPAMAWWLCSMVMPLDVHRALMNTFDAELRARWNTDRQSGIADFLGRFARSVQPMDRIEWK
jgi:hypothetical protein